MSSDRRRSARYANLDRGGRSPDGGDGGRSRGRGDRRSPDRGSDGRSSERADGERAQSELVGFVLVFSLMVTIIALVTLAGFAELGDVRSVERENGAQRGMVAVAENADEVATGGAPSRATELRLSQGSISVGDPVTFRIEGHRVGDPSRNISREVTVRPVVQDLRSGGQVVYVTGAVVREGERGGSVMVRDPNLVLTDERTVLPLVDAVPARNRQVSGTGTVLVRTVRGGSTVHNVTDAPYEVTVEVTSPRAKAWFAYLDGRPATACSRSGDTVSCSFTSDRVTLSTIRLRVEFD